MKLQLPRYWYLVVLLGIILAHCAAPLFGGQGIPKDCGPGVSVTLAEDWTGKFDIVRACELYGDLIKHHIPNTTERPGVVFHVVKDMDKQCETPDLTSSIRGVLVGCLRRSRTATDIWIREDKPDFYIVQMVDGLDYANRLYLPREFIHRECTEALIELERPEARRRFHATVDVRDRRN